MCVRGSWRPNRTAIYWPPLLWPLTLCLSRSPGLLNQRPRGSAFCWVLAFSTTSCHQQVSKTTGGPEGSEGPFDLVWFFPYHISSLTPTLTVLTELYNSSTPTQSLEWHFWSSSSGNNCHAVQRSLSPGASVYECTMGFFTLSCFVSQARLRDFLS